MSGPERSQEGARVRSISRRVFVGAAAAALATGPLKVAAGRAAFRFGLTPVFLTNDRRLIAAMHTYLRGTLGRPVELIQRRTYQEITAMLLAGQLDAAWICGFPFVVHRDALALVAVPLWRGKPLYQSYLITAPGRDAHDLPDLRGDIHAFSDPDSNSGYLVTRTRLARMELSPAEYFSRVFFTYGHRNVVRAVATGLAHSGSVDGYIWEALSRAEPDLTERTQVIWRSQEFGFPPIACLRERAHDPEIRTFRRALLDIGTSPAGRETIGLLQLDGFATPPPEIFDGIAAMVRFLHKRA